MLRAYPLLGRLCICKKVMILHKSDKAGLALRQYCRVSTTFTSECTRLGDILDNWNSSPQTQDSLTRCLYACLKTASVQKISSEQLVQFPQFQEFWQHLCSEVPRMSPNTAVMSLYNCAKYNFNVDGFSFNDLVSVCLKKVEIIPPKAFGILLWSLYKLDIYHHNQALVSRVVERFRAQLLSGNVFKPQAFANVLWVLASTHTWPLFLTEAVVEYVPQRICHYDFHTISIILWAVTKANLQPSDVFLRAAGDRAASLLPKEIKTISLVHCCWSFGSASFYHEPFFTSLRDKILSEHECSPFLTPRLLSSVAWACARARYYQAELLDHIAEVSLSKLDQFNSQDLGNLAYSYGYLNHSSNKLLLAISHIMSSQPEMAANELACANVANSCLIHKLYPEPLLSKLMAHQRVAALIELGDDRHLHFCIQAHSLIKVECPSMESCVLKPHQDKVVTALVLAHAMVQCQRTYSVFHKNICKGLLQITGSTRHFIKEALTTSCYFIDAEVILDNEGKPVGIPPQWGGWRQPRQLLSTAYLEKENTALWHTLNKAVTVDATLEEGVSVASDWAIELGYPVQSVGRKIAIEADGPRHYAVNCKHKLGNTVLKQRTLKAQGWDLLEIPYFEWQILESDQDQIEYLERRLFCQTSNSV